MASDTVPFGALSAVGLNSGEKFRMLPSPLSVMTARFSAVIPFTPRQTPEHGAASTVSGFELDTIDEDDQDLESISTVSQHTPASSQASFLGDLEDEHTLTPEVQHLLETMALRIEQLVEQNELQAEELRRYEKKSKKGKRKKQKKERKSEEEMAKYQTDVMRELLRAVTVVMTPMPEGSPARFVLMAVEAFFLRERVVDSPKNPELFIKPLSSTAGASSNPPSNFEPRIATYLTIFTTRSMRLPRAEMADDMNAQAISKAEQDTGEKNCECDQSHTFCDTTHTITIAEQLPKATDMECDLSSTLPDPESTNDMKKTPNLPTFPSLPTSSNSTFYLAPSIIEAMQRLFPAMLVSPPTFCSFSDSPNPGQTTLESDYNTAESFPDNQTLNPSSNNTFTSETTQQEQAKDPKHAAGPFARVDEESSDLKEQATIGQQKEMEAKMLEYYEIQLEQRDLELAAAEKSNTQLRATLSLMEDELAGAQAKLDQKNIYISGCDKKIDALQKKIALLTRPHTGPTLWQMRTDIKMNVNTGPQFHTSTSKPKKIYIPPTQPSAEARLNGVDYKAPSEEKAAPVIQVCEQSSRRQAGLEDHSTSKARSGKRRRVAEGYLWGNHEPSKETKELGQENEELRKELNQAHAADTSKSGPVSFRPKMSGGALDTVPRQEISETTTSHTEADRAKDTQGEGHGDTGQRANSLLSQKSTCSFDWENVEGDDLEKGWPYAWW
ncbi:hypothetical protein KCU71_g567, partial [Aureobasidium melanogenum]